MTEDKKSKGALFGMIATGIGIFLTIFSSDAKSNSYRYTSEAQAFMETINNLGILLLICGILTIIIIVLSSHYYNSNVKEINSSTVLQCPKCKLQLIAGTHKCPRCGHEIEK